ncbi:MAG: rhodanese-like domain-containing protein [Mariniblastus sp.]
MRLAAAFILLLTMTGCYDSPKPTTETTPAQGATDKAEPSEADFLADALKQVKSGTALLVDVRSDEEWAESHFDVAKHIPVDKIKSDPEAAFSDIKKEQTVFLH